MKFKPLTVEELKERGYCCGNRCVNCPYVPTHQRGSTRTKIDRLDKLIESMLNWQFKISGIHAP